MAARLKCVASGRVSGRRLHYLVVSLMFVLLPGLTGVAQAQSDSNGTEEPLYDIDIPQLDAAEALNRFAEQTGAVMLFPYDLAQARMANAVRGRYTLVAALEALLEDTGLTGGLSDKRVIQISTSEADVRRGEREAMKTNKKATLITVVAGVLTGNAAAQAVVDSAETAAETSIVTGKVTDARTGANLKGALVTIEETGQSTSTDHLGDFRFASVAAGDYTLRISYLGYEQQNSEIRLRRGQAVSARFALVGASELEEIVVFGQRSARAQSLNLERTAKNSITVLSADALGSFNGTTISEALRRAPGVAFVPDELSGEGSNIIVRGLEPDLNQVTLNGLRLLDGSGVGRSPDLGNILTENIDTVTIHKSLLPSMDTNGAGGLVEIETKSPLDRESRFASFSAEYGENLGDFGDEFGVNGTISGILGADQSFGASLSVSHRKRETERLSYSLIGSGLGVYPLDDDGNPVSNVLDPRTPFPFVDGLDTIYTTSVGANLGETEIENNTGTLALQKTFGSHTDLRLDLTFNEDRTTNFQTTTSYGQGERAEFTSSVLAPVPELGGGERFVFSPDAGDGTIFGRVRRFANYEPERIETTLSTSLRGSTDIGLWELDYIFGFSRSESDPGRNARIAFDQEDAGAGGFPPILGPRSFFTDEALNNTYGNGLVRTVISPLPRQSGEFVIPFFSQEGFDFYNDIDGLAVNDIRIGETESGDGQARTIAFDVRRNLEHRNIKYFSAGLNYQDTEFSAGHAFTDLYDPASGRSAFDVGLRFGPGVLSRVGGTGDLPAITRQSLENVFWNLEDLSAQGILVEDFIAPRDTIGTEVQIRDTSEATIAAYLETQLVFGNLEIVGGVRVEEIEIESTAFRGPNVLDVDFSFPVTLVEFGEVVTEAVSQTDVLPRIAMNYRFSEDSVVRGTYYKTVSRPQLGNISDVTDIFLFLPPIFSSTGDRPTLEIQRGNPGLEPAVTHNFGLDWERYFEDVGVIKVALFYKETENPLQRNLVRGDLDLLPEDLSLPDLPFFNPLPDPIELKITQPVNGEDDDRIWGVELAGERQLTFLPGWWAGWGLYANYTYTDSETTQPRTVVPAIDESRILKIKTPYAGSPEHQGTLGLTYAMYGFDGSLYYTAQSRRLSFYRPNGLSAYSESVETLDFRLDYNTTIRGSNVRFFIRGEDLLNGKDDPFLQTSMGGEGPTPKYYTGGTFLGGRSIFLGASVTY